MGNRTFAGFAYGEQTGSQAIAGNITVDRFRFAFHSDQAVLEIPLVRLEIEAGGPTDRRVYFRHCEQEGWTIYTFEEGILAHPAFREQTHTRMQIAQIRSAGELTRRLKLVGWFLAGFAILAVAVWIISGWMVSSIVAGVPVSLEQDLGDQALTELKDQKSFLDDPKRIALLTNAVAPLLAALPPDRLQYRFYLMEEPLPNAFALPGGHVVFTTGLLELADGAEELAAVAAHEIAHVRQRHLFRQIVSAAGPYLLVRIFVGDRGGLAGVLGASSELMVRQSFSQKYELEADALAWEYLVRSRIDPRSLPEILRKLEAAQSRYKGFEIQAFSTHPATEKRIRRLEQKWADLKGKEAFAGRGERAH